nr:hypothetical protein [Propionibacterium sp.]
MKTTTALWVAPIATVAILFGSIGIASATGAWVTSGKQQITATSQLTVDDFKGWMTLQQAADGVGLDVATLITLVGAPAGVTITPTTAFKDLESLVPGFELGDFKERVRALVGGAPAPTTGPTGGSTASPAPSPSVPASSVAPSPSHTPSPTGTGTGSGASITGQMTIRQVAEAYGLDPAVLARESGVPAGISVDAALKDLKNAVPGFEIQQVRDAVERLT